ncbi:hypothetical protein QTP86_020046 [Hemibagrus guttatus]|nr:hypothetical protein QTP86_020046 [Hemibagrus guttatus]
MWIPSRLPDIPICPGHGGLVVSTFASQLQCWGFGSHLCCVCGVCMFSPCLGGFLPRSKDMHCRLIGISKLSIVCDCVSE